MANTADVEFFARYLRGSRLEFDANDAAGYDPIVVRPLEYVDQWKTCTSKGWYSYRLTDHSLFIFRGGEQPSYAFMQCPFAALPLKVFAREFLGAIGADVYSSAVREEYEQYITTLPLRKHILYLRLDVDAVGFDALSHPISHLHVGFSSDIRIGTSRYWTPTAFGLFIIRQCYPEQWRFLVESNLHDSLSRRVRKGLVLVDDEFLAGYTREVWLS
jgi:hypothetical protein